MAIVDVGDLLINNTTRKLYIATSCDFTCRVAGTGEFIDDCSFIPAVSVINPATGSTFKVYLRDVKKLTGTWRV